jgi:hypothetical protein
MTQPFLLSPSSSGGSSDLHHIYTSMYYIRVFIYNTVHTTSGRRQEKGGSLTAQKVVSDRWRDSLGNIQYCEPTDVQTVKTVQPSPSAVLPGRQYTILHPMVLGPHLYRQLVTVHTSPPTVARPQVVQTVRTVHTSSPDGSGPTVVQSVGTIHTSPPTGFKAHSFTRAVYGESCAVLWHNALQADFTVLMTHSVKNLSK